MFEVDPMIEVPQPWLKTLADIAKTVHDQMDKLPPEDFLVLSKTDISAFVGHASSAETIINLNGIARRNPR